MLDPRMIVLSMSKNAAAPGPAFSGSSALIPSVSQALEGSVASSTPSGPSARDLPAVVRVR